MRRMLPVLCLLLAAPLLAQRTSPLGTLERFEADLRADAVALKRDAFIVSQVMVGIGELHDDFQQNTAIQKALDRIEAAQVRGGEKPPAHPKVMATLSAIRDDLLEARKQGGMADMPALERTLARRARDLRNMLFHELDDIRRQRQILADLQTRVARLTTEVDDAMGEALGATFDYVRSAGD